MHANNNCSVVLWLYSCFTYQFCIIYQKFSETILKISSHIHSEKGVSYYVHTLWKIVIYKIKIIINIGGKLYSMKWKGNA